MKTSEIRELTVAEIEERIDAEKANLLRQKLNHSVSPVENPTTLKKARRDIARMMTILAEKQNVEISERKESGWLSAIRWINPLRLP